MAVSAAYVQGVNNGSKRRVPVITIQALTHLASQFYDACKSLDVERVLMFFTKEIEIEPASGASIEG